jgi:uncharacterized membrane protein YbhN (UPF0104 family)
MRFGLRVLVSVGLLFGLVWWLDLGSVVSRLTSMRLEWMVLAVAISVVQVWILAWRWRFTAGRLGVELSFATAWREYYLSIFLNQVLPGGVMGDVSRAWRQARGLAGGREPAGPAVRAVIFERISAQVVMTTVALGSLLVLAITIDDWSLLAFMVAGTAVVLVIVAAFLWIRLQSSTGSLAGLALADLVAAHWSRSALLPQLVSGLLVVGSYLATYLAAARAVGVETPLPVLLPLIAPVLMTMLIPVTVAGWGLRESGAALLWGAVGLTAADGVTTSVAYGLVVLLSSLPGATMLVLGPGARRAPSV